MVRMWRHAAGRELFLLRLERASMLLFCKLAIPVLDIPQHQRRRKAGLTQLEELLAVLKTSEASIYFQADVEATTLPFEFHSLERLLEIAGSISTGSENEQTPELVAAFLLRAPLMKALEVIGVGTASVGDDIQAPPLHCTPEGEQEHGKLRGRSGLILFKKLHSSYSVSPSCGAQGPLLGYGTPRPSIRTPA